MGLKSSAGGYGSGTSPQASSVLNFLSYLNEEPVPTSDVTTSLQNFLLACQLTALSLKTTPLDNVSQRTCVNAYLPRGYYNVSCPIVVPEYVNLVSDGVIVRNGQSGTVTSFYTGDTTSQALANLFQPTVVVVPRGHAERLSIVCNSNGSDRGSGLAAGKNWTMGTPVIAAAGLNYRVNDVLTFSQPSLAPYVAATAVVNAVDGSGRITSISIVEPGAYGLPPVLQAKQWTAANGFTGIFDSYGNLAVSGGSGSGASLQPVWIADWIAGGPVYLYGRGGLISDTQLGKLNIVQSQIVNDATYGPTFCLYLGGLNTVIEEIESLFGFDAVLFRYCSDTRISKLNPVNSQTGIYLQNCFSIECPNIIVDTFVGQGLDLEVCSSIRLAGKMFFRSLSNLGFAAAATVTLNAFNTSLNQNIGLNFDLQAAGVGGDTNHISSIGCPALSIAYTQGFDINLNVTNYDVGYSGLFPVISSFAQFGNSVSDGRLRGSIDHTFGSLFSGTIPPTVDIDIWDADVSIVNGSITATVAGTIATGDHITLTFTNSHFAQTYAWPRTPSYVVQAGDTATTIAAGLAAAINSDAALSINGVHASNAGAVITIVQMGMDANSTTLAATITGSETVSFSNSGAMSGSISGGRVGPGGLYQLCGNGAPSNGITGTGWNKAPKGSKYTDTSTGNFYTNTGSASSVNWTQI